MRSDVRDHDDLTTDDVRSVLRSSLREAGLDALITLSPENVCYSSEVVIPSHQLMRWRHAAHVLSADGREAIICVDMEEATVRAARPQVPVRVWREFGGDPMLTLAEVLRDFGLEQARVGTELHYLAYADQQRLVAELPRIRLVGIDALLAQVRSVKTTRERQLLGRLSRISDRAIGTALQQVRAGDSEMDIAAAVTRSVYEQGAEAFKLLIVATGERSQLPNVGPTERVLRPGDVCRVEVFSVSGGYQAGVCRTAVVGDPPPGAEEFYAHLVRCKYEVLDALRVGARASSVYAAYRASFDALGVDPISFVGHSIGVNLHEPPYLGPSDEGILAEGMVLGIEPLAYRTGHGWGMQIKDMVELHNGRARLLSDVTDTDRLVRVEA